MTVELGTGYITVLPSAKGFGSALSKEMGSAGDAAGAAASKSFGGKFTAGLGAVAKTAAVGFTAATGAALGVGVALYAVGDAFDSAYDRIRVGTGATGDALAGLEDDFKAVVQNVPASFDDASTAIADLNTRLGVTGAPLQSLAGQMLELSRITETDLATNVDNLTRVFGDWQISTDQMPDALDKVYRASQASGIGVDELSQSVVQFGAPLRNLGFSFDDSLALLAKFNKEGVNTSTVFAGMKAGVGKLAKAGEPVPATFARVVGEIQKLGPGSEATAKAIELFGQRAGPDLADAIAGGKFELTGMLDAIQNGGDTIMGAGADTQDFAEKFQLLKNKVLVGLEPIAARVFGALADGIDRVAPLAAEVAGGFRALFAAFQDGGNDVTSSGIAGAFERVGIVARDVFDAVRPRVEQFVAALRSVDWAGVFADAQAFLTPIVASVGELASAVIDFAVAAWPKVQAAIAFALPILQTVATVIGDTLGAAVRLLARNFDTLAPALVAAGGAFAAFKGAQAVKSGFDTASSAVSKFTSNVGKAKDAASKAAGGVKAFFSPGGGSDTLRLRAMQATDAIKKAGGALKSGVSAAASWASAMAKSAAVTVKDTAAKVASKAASVAMSAATKIAAAAQAAFNFVMSANPIVLVVLAIAGLVAALVLAYNKVGWFRAFVDAAFRVIKSGAEAAFGFVKRIVETVLPIIATVISTYFNVYKTVITTVLNVIKTVISTVWNGIKTAVTTVVTAIRTVIQTYFNAYKAVITTALNAAKAVVTSVWNGIKSTISGVVNGVKTTVSTGFSAVKGFLTKPIEEAKTTVSGILDGIKTLFTDLPGNLSSALSSLASTIAAPFEAMGDAIRDAWNSTVGGKGFTIPDVPGVPGRGTRVEIPRLHSGGPVTGVGEQLRILEAGEWVLSREQVRNLSGGVTPLPTVPASRAGVEFSGDIYLSDEIDLDVLDRKMTFGLLAASA